MRATSKPLQALTAANLMNPEVVRLPGEMPLRDAARLLLIPECLKKGESLVALVPHRDMLVLGPADLEHDRSKLEAGLRALDCQDHPPLLNQPVRVTSAGFEMIDLSGAPAPASA